MESYDVILTLGNGFSDTWGVPETVQARLKTIVDLYTNKVSDKILISGGYSISWDVIGVKPPTTEAQEMKKFLVTLGIPETQIFTEEESKDTIGNFYYSKIKYLRPKDWKKILVVSTDTHVRRVRFLSQKILGPEYTLHFQKTPSRSSQDTKFLKDQDIFYEKQKLFLKAMTTGDDAFLTDKLYKDPFYKSRKPEEVTEFTMKGMK